MQNIISYYKTLIEGLGEMIRVSGYRSDYIARKIGMKAANFSLKKQRGNWTVDEVQNVIAVIENEDTENYLMLELMRAAKEEETVSYDEFQKEMGWK
jgi:hypothetical protein